MNKKIIETNSEPVDPSSVDQRRRKLSTAGIASTGIIFSVTSRSAMGGWGQCTGSELASGNLSRTGTLNPCGCSPGYWFNNNGEETWNKYLFASFPRSTAKFNATFGRTYLSPDTLMANCQNGNSSPARISVYNTEDMKNVAFHAVAALLNAAFYGARYPVPNMQTPGAVVIAFQAAFDALGDNAARRAAMTAFVTKVDVYKVGAGTWCNGKPHGNV